jgi:nucleoid-associated protein YgaU
MAACAVIVFGLSAAAFGQAGEDAQAMPGAKSPAPSQAAPATPEPAPPTAAASYVVQEGDTLSLIAKKLTGNEANWTEIARANGISDPTKLQVGMSLRIPSELSSS